MPARPNVLIFMVDQHRQEAAGCYGNALCQTPHLDRLAAEGVRFTEAYTPAPICSPARASLWTGLWPTRHGITLNTGGLISADQRIYLADDQITLADLCQRAGYATAYFGKWHVGPDSEIRRRGYDHAVPVRAYHEFVRANQFRFRIWDEVRLPYPWMGPTPCAGITSADGEAFREVWLCRRAEEWLAARDRARPFFAVVSLPGPHWPCLVPERYAARYDAARVPVTPNMTDPLAGKPAIHRFYRDIVAQSGTLTVAQWQHCIALYYAYITLIDEQLGRLLALLDAQGVAESTIVLYLTDHGDLMGVHGLWDKGPFMYEEQLRLPLVMRWPGTIPAGAVRTPIVTLLDIMPTLLAAVELECPEQLDGRSLWPVIRGESVTDWPDDTFFQFHGQERGVFDVRAVHTKRYKFVYYPHDRDELYDLQEDPWELHNLIDDPAAAPVLADLRERMLRWMERADDSIRHWPKQLRAPSPWTGPGYD